MYRKLTKFVKLKRRQDIKYTWDNNWTNIIKFLIKLRLYALYCSTQYNFLPCHISQLYFSHSHVFLPITIIDACLMSNFNTKVCSLFVCVKIEFNYSKFRASNVKSCFICISGVEMLLLRQSQI